MAKKGKLTPMMQQYMQIKEENKDCNLILSPWRFL